MGGCISAVFIFVIVAAGISTVIVSIRMGGRISAVFIIVIVAAGPAALILVRDDQTHITVDIRAIDIGRAGIVDVIDNCRAAVVKLSFHFAVPAVDKDLGAVDQTDGVSTTALIGNPAHGAIGWLRRRRGPRRIAGDVNVCRAGVGSLAFVIEGAVSAPAVHPGLQIADGDGCAVFTVDIGAGAGHKVCGGIFAAVRRDEGPLQRIVGVGARNEDSVFTDASVLIGRILSDGEVGGLDGCRGGSWCRCGRRSRCRGCLLFRPSKRGRLRDRKSLSRFSGAEEDLVALGQAVQIANFVSGEPLKGGVASLCSGKRIGTGVIILCRRDADSVGICMRDSPGSIAQLCVLDGIRVVGYDIVFQGDSRLDGIDLGVRDHNVVIDHVIPGVSIFDMIGINRIGHDVGKGFSSILIQRAFDQACSIFTDRPDLEVG